MISICIPVRDGGPEFGQNLLAWKQQETSEVVEILVLDSGSRDDTRKIAQDLGTKVYTLPSQEFNHGEARNRLAALARGDLLVFTVADAAPAGPRTLQQLTEPLRQDPELAGVTGKQLPRKDADLVAKWETEFCTYTSDGQVVRKVLPPWSEFSQLDFVTKIRLVGFDDVCSAMRRTVWEKFPFSPVEFAEDLDWSLRVMKSGYPILANPKAQVLHSHNRSAWARFRHYFVGRYRMNMVLGVPSEVFPWSEDEAFAAVRSFRSRVGKVRDTLQESSPFLTRLRIPVRFKYLCFRTIDKWGPLALGGFHQPLLHPYAVEWLESYFNYICWCVLRRYERLSRQEALFVADQAEAQATGDFLGQCYYRSKHTSCISPEFAQLGWLLRRHFGVVFDGSPPPQAPEVSS